MRTPPILIAAALACALLAPVATGQEVNLRFECANGIPIKLVWDTMANRTYDLWRSPDLVQWTHVEGYPKAGTGAPHEYPFTAAACGFFKISVGMAAPEGFVLIPAGAFLMGDQSSPPVGGAEERPVHSVSVSAFYMAKYEVTKELWDEVRAWGLNNGYTDLAQGNGSSPSKGPNHPVHSVTWFDVVKWCNARSEKENLTPCYTVAGAVYRTGQSAPDCNWNADGHRLPTEAEWEKAARGGLAGLNFPWGDAITHDNANYQSTTNYSYDVSKTRGYHPTYATGLMPYTSPVGAFAANNHGLHDMAGNMREWCWDWLSGTYYSASPATDPRGPADSMWRVHRGGCWQTDGSFARVAYRDGLLPDRRYASIGFRPARNATP